MGDFRGIRLFTSHLFLGSSCIDNNTFKKYLTDFESVKNRKMRKKCVEFKDI